MELRGEYGSPSFLFLLSLSKAASIRLEFSSWTRSFITKQEQVAQARDRRSKEDKELSQAGI